MQEIILHACQPVRIISWMCGDSIVMMDMSLDLVDMSYLLNEFMAHTEENELDKANHLASSRRLQQPWY